MLTFANGSLGVDNLPICGAAEEGSASGHGPSFLRDGLAHSVWVQSEELARASNNTHDSFRAQTGVHAYQEFSLACGALKVRIILARPLTHTHHMAGQLEKDYQAWLVKRLAGLGLEVSGRMSERLCD